MSTSDLTVAARLVAKLLAHRQTPQEEVAGVIRSVHGALSRLVAEGTLRNAVTATPTFDELPSALQRLADRTVIGKLVMVP